MEQVVAEAELLEEAAPVFLLRIRVMVGMEILAEILRLVVILPVVLLTQGGEHIIKIVVIILLAVVEALNLNVLLLDTAIA